LSTAAINVENLREDLEDGIDQPSVRLLKIVRLVVKIDDNQIDQNSKTMTMLY
jgi:hypothetical protein